MLFGLSNFSLSRYGMWRWFEANADGGAAAGEDKKTEDGAGSEAEKEKKASEEKAGELKFSQQDVDAIIADRLARERKKSEEQAEKARKKAEDEALEKNKEWEQLATTRAQELEAVTKERDELAGYKEQADKYKAVLDAQLADAKKALPKHIVTLLDKMDPLDALQYLSENSKELGVKAKSYPETPEGKEQKELSADERARGAKAVTQVITHGF